MAENQENHQQEQKEKQDCPAVGRGAVIAGIICIAALAAAFALFAVQGGFGYRSKNGGMVNNPAMQEKQAQKDSASISAGKQTKSVDSDNIKYSSTAIDKMGCETLAAMVLDKSKQKEDLSLRQYFYSRGLSGMRYQTDSFLASIKSTTADHINKKLAKALGIRYATFVNNYTWMVATGHKGSTYDGNKYGFDIYWANQGLSAKEARQRVPVVYYNTKGKKFQNGTIMTAFLRQTEIGFDRKTFEAGK